jgi:GIY-YIG catalytic domain
MLMPIDACTSSFAEMATVVLPADMARLRTALAAPLAMSSFCVPGVGVKTILSRLRRSGDFSGCYVLLREGKPFYVGISRTVVQRLRQHVTGNTHFDASLAYLMATAKTGHDMKRSDAMQDAGSRIAFEKAGRCCAIAVWRLLRSKTLSNFTCLKRTARCSWTPANGTLFELIDQRFYGSMVSHLWCQARAGLK